jgi:hypothetical protein
MKLRKGKAKTILEGALDSALLAVEVYNKPRTQFRTRDWRRISYADGAKELYDHRTDPDEFRNLAKDPKYQTVIKRLAIVCI